MEKEKKLLWFLVDKKTTPLILNKIFHLEYNLLVSPYSLVDVLNKIKLPQRINLAIIINSIDEFLELQKNNISKKITYIFAKNITLSKQIKAKNIKKGLYVVINDKKSLDQAVNSINEIDALIVKMTDTTNIPLELLIATAKDNKTKILKVVKNYQDAELSLATMEKGSDGVVLNSDDIKEIMNLNKIFQKLTKEKFTLKEAIVTDVKHVGMGDRVCVDITSKLSQDEGMLLGSTSSGGILICSETHYLPYMNLRPFRVNAGPLHLYIWGPDNKVVYLSDLKTGDKTLAVNKNGTARVVTIGRLKIEKRPLLLIAAEIEGKKINTFIQDDWHVRLFGANNKILPSSEIKIGEKLIGYLDNPGRHVGIKIKETIQEM